MFRLKFSFWIFSQLSWRNSCINNQESIFSLVVFVRFWYWRLLWPLRRSIIEASPPKTILRAFQQSLNATKYRLVCYYGLGRSSEQPKHCATNLRNVWCCHMKTRGPLMDVNSGLACHQGEGELSGTANLSEIYRSESLEGMNHGTIIKEKSEVIIDCT